MDNFRFLLQSALDVARSKTNINLDIHRLQSQADQLRIKAELDPGSVKNVRLQIESLTKRLNSDVRNSESISKNIFNVKDLKKQGKEYFRYVDKSIGEMSFQFDKKFKRLGVRNIDVSGIESARDAIKELYQSASTAEKSLKNIDFGRTLSPKTKNQKMLAPDRKAAVFNHPAPVKFIQKGDDHAQQANDLLTDALIESVSNIGIYRFIENQLKDSIDELKKFDSILTQISINSDLTTSQLNKLGDASFETASKYGQKASEYLTNVQALYRAGNEHAEQLAELSLLTQAASDMDATDATNYLIATDAAYHLKGNMEVLNEVLDSQTYISKENALSLSDLAQATKIAAHQSADSGIAIDETTAALGTMIAATQQGGEIAANAWKGILMSIQQVKGEVEDGEIIDDEALYDFEKACIDLGVSLKDVNGGIISLRDPMAVIKELAEAYSALDESDARRANLTDAVGGNNSGSQLNALLENYSLYQTMLNQYGQGTGSAMDEAMKSADSWEGSLNRLNNTMTDIIGNIANSDSIVGVINSLNSLFEMLNKVSSVLGSAGTVGAATGITLFIKNLDYQKVLKIA